MSFERSRWMVVTCVTRHTALRERVAPSPSRGRDACTDASTCQLTGPAWPRRRRRSGAPELPPGAGAAPRAGIRRRSKTLAPSLPPTAQVPTDLRKATCLLRSFRQRRSRRRLHAPQVEQLHPAAARNKHAVSRQRRVARRRLHGRHRARQLGRGSSSAYPHVPCFHPAVQAAAQQRGAAAAATRSAVPAAMSPLPAVPAATRQRQARHRGPMAPQHSDRLLQRSQQGTRAVMPIGQHGPRHQTPRPPPPPPHTHRLACAGEGSRGARPHSRTVRSLEAGGREGHALHAQHTTGLPLCRQAASTGVRLCSTGAHATARFHQLQARQRLGVAPHRAHGREQGDGQVIVMVGCTAHVGGPQPAAEGRAARRGPARRPPHAKSVCPGTAASPPECLVMRSGDEAHAACRAPPSRAMRQRQRGRCGRSTGSSVRRAHHVRQHIVAPPNFPERPG